MLRYVKRHWWARFGLTNLLSPQRLHVGPQIFDHRTSDPLKTKTTTKSYTELVTVPKRLVPQTIARTNNSLITACMHRPTKGLVAVDIHKGFDHHRYLHLYKSLTPTRTHKLLKAKETLKYTNTETNKLWASQTVKNQKPLRVSINLWPAQISMNTVHHAFFTARRGKNSLARLTNH